VKKISDKTTEEMIVEAAKILAGILPERLKNFLISYPTKKDEESSIV